MNRRSIHISMSLAVGLLCLAFAPKAARADDLPKSCQETTQRVLKPFLDNLKAAQEALKQYEKQNADKIESINEQIRLRTESKNIFDDAKAKEDKDFGNRIKWAREAIHEATADAQKRIAEKRKLAAAARAAGRDRQAQAHTDAAAQIAAALAAGKTEWYKQELRLKRSINGWRDYIQKQTQDRAKRMADYAAGKVTHYIQTLRWHATWQGVLKSIEEKRAELAKANARGFTFYLQAIRQHLDGKGIDDYLATRTEELADARARIAAGTFVVYVQALRLHRDRNAVQQIVADARQKYRQTVQAWAAKTYSNYNPMPRDHLTNGQIEEAIAKKQQELMDFQAAHDDAKVYAAGAHRTAREIREQIGAKQALGDRDGYDQWHKILAAWHKARAEWIANKEKEIQHWEAVLARHEEVHKEDLKNQKAHIDGRLQDALDQTPCGGSGGAVDPDDKVVNDHLTQLDGLTESDEEKKRRRDWYGDKIYVEPDGTVHGDPRDAWANALRDTGLTPSQQQSFAEWLFSVKSILDSKNLADWLAALKDANEMRQATGLIDEFIKLMEGIDIKTMKNADFYKQRRAIKQMLPRVTAALEKGVLSPGRLQKYIDALKKSGSATRQTRDQLKSLQSLLDLSVDAKSMWRSTSAIRNVGTALATDAAAAYRTFVSGSGKQVMDRLDAAYGSMTKLEKGLFFLSLAAATAEAHDRMNKGEAASEAIARSSVNLVIDLAIAGVPVTAAAEMATQIMFTTYGHATGDMGVADATLSNTTKWVAEQALNEVAGGAASLGEASIALERMVFNEPNIKEILGNVSYERLRQSLSHVEDRIAALPPGHANERRLLRIREAFRILLRAKQNQP